MKRLVRYTVYATGICLVLWCLVAAVLMFVVNDPVHGLVRLSGAFGIALVVITCMLGIVMLCWKVKMWAWDTGTDESHHND